MDNYLWNDILADGLCLKLTRELTVLGPNLWEWDLLPSTPPSLSAFQASGYTADPRSFSQFKTRIGLNWKHWQWQELVQFYGRSAPAPGRRALVLPLPLWLGASASQRRKSGATTDYQWQNYHL